MFGSIGGPEFLLIAALALLLFGPRQLPKIGRSIGRALAEFRGATQEFKSSLEKEVELEGLNEVKDGIQAARSEVHSAVKEVTRPTFARGEGDRRPAADATPSEPGCEDAAREEGDAPSGNGSDGDTPAQS